MADNYNISHITVSQNHNETRFKNVIEYIKEYSSTKSEDEAFVFVSTDGGRQSITWSNLYERSRSAASALLHLGVKRKEIVAINLRPCPEWIYATFGAMLAGAIPVSVSFTYTDGSDLVELMQKLQNCSVLIMDPGADNVNWNIIKKLLDENDGSGKIKSTKLSYLRYLIGVKFDECFGVKDFDDLLYGTQYAMDFPDIESEDVATMLQTSGSTGEPKLAVHTHASVISLSASNLKAIDPNYKVFNDRPFNWLGGYPFSVLTGQTRVTVSGFCEPPENRVEFMKEIIIKERCTLILTLPPLLAELIRIKDELPSNWPVVGIMTGGQPITKSVSEIVGKAGKFLCCMYGSTEAMLLTQIVVSDSKSFTEFACGAPLNLKGIEMKIVDENGRTLPINTTGEIYARSPGMFRGYFNDPDKTKAVMTTDGWYKTDDMGRMTQNGEFFVEGRKSNKIISGGMTVAPEILEQVMKIIPGVASAVIVPVPDSVNYQVVCACVVKKPGSELNVELLREYCENLHADKPGLFTVLPKFYLLLERFPETNTGKIDRKEIERVACNKFK